MKQGKVYTKIILCIFLAAVLCYFGYYIFSAIYAPLTTTTAIAYEAGTGSYTTGFVVRQETLVSSDYDITNLVVSEGERVAKGQTVATGYRKIGPQAGDGVIQVEDGKWTRIRIPLTYGSDADPAYTHLSVAFASSWQGDIFTGVKGSELKVDNVRIIYE